MPKTPKNSSKLSDILQNDEINSCVEAEILDKIQKKA
jgi:hypothetical protein